MRSRESLKADTARKTVNTAKVPSSYQENLQPSVHPVRHVVEALEKRVEEHGAHVVERPGGFLANEAWEH
eukprot:3931406-Amphidinium_carterae.1